MSLSYKHIQRIFILFPISIHVVCQKTLFYIVPYENPNRRRYGFWKPWIFFILNQLSFFLRCSSEVFIHMPSLRWIAALLCNSNSIGSVHMSQNHSYRQSSTSWGACRIYRFVLGFMEKKILLPDYENTSPSKNQIPSTKMDVEE